MKKSFLEKKAVSLNLACFAVQSFYLGFISIP